LTINQLSLSENALKLTYGIVEFPNFPGRIPGTPLQGREREKSGREKRVGEGREWGDRKGREGLKEREGMERGEKGQRGRGEEFGPPMFQTDRRHCQLGLL
jgi:hypothetical protein